MPAYFDNEPEDISTRNYTEQDLYPTLGQSVNASFRSALNDSVGGTVAQMFQSPQYDVTKPALKKIDADAMIEQAGLKGAIKVTNDYQYSADSLKSLIASKQEQAINADILDRAQSGWVGTPARFAAQLAGSVLDPGNLAFGLFPTGEAAGLAKNALAGFIQGAAGVATLQPIYALAKDQTQQDYTATDAMHSIVMGGMFGGGMHALFSAPASLEKLANPYIERYKQLDKDNVPVSFSTLSNDMPQEKPQENQPLPELKQPQVELSELKLDSNNHVSLDNNEAAYKYFDQFPKDVLPSYLNDDGSINQFGAMEFRDHIVSSAFSKDMSLVTYSEDPAINKLSNSLFRLAPELEKQPNDILSDTVLKIAQDFQAKDMLNDISPRDLTDRLQQLIKNPLPTVDDNIQALQLPTNNISKPEQLDNIKLDNDLKDLLTGRTNAIPSAMKKVDMLEPVAKEATFKSALAQVAQGQYPQVEASVNGHLNDNLDFDAIKADADKANSVENNLGYNEILPEPDLKLDDNAAIDNHLANALNELNSIVKKNEEETLVNPENIKYSASEVLGSSTIKELERSLKESYKESGAILMQAKAINIVDKLTDLPKLTESEYPANTKAIINNERTYIVASNVTVPELKGLVLHEIGVHSGGMKIVLGEAGLNNLYRHINERIAAGDTTYLAARQMALDANTPKHLMDEETLAYLVQNFAKTFQRDTGWFTKVKSWFMSRFPSLQKIFGMSDQDIYHMSQKAVGVYTRNRLKGYHVFAPSDIEAVQQDLKAVDESANEARGAIDALRPNLDLLDNKEAYIESTKALGIKKSIASDTFDAINAKYKKFLRKSDPDPLESAMNEYQQELEFNLKAEKLKRVKDNVARLTGAQRVMTEFIANPQEGMRSLYFGSNFAKLGSRVYADGYSDMLNTHYQSRLEKLLPKDLNKLFKNGDMDKNIIEALDLLDHEENTSHLPKEAVQIAKAWNQVLEEIRQERNKNGLVTRQFKGYIFNQSYAHDFDVLQKTSESQWLDLANKHFDLERMADNMNITPDKLAKDVLPVIYQRLKSGSYIGAFDGDFDTEGLLSRGGTKLASAGSKSRVIMFKRGEFYNYFKEMGGKQNLASAILSTIRSNSRAIGIAKTLGVSYEANLKAIGEAVSKSLIDPRMKGDLDKYTKFTLPLELAGLDGRVNIPLNYTLARNFSNVRAIQSMAKLGGSTISSFPDVINLKFASMDKSTNILSVLHDFGKFTADNIKGDKELMAELGNTGLFTESIIADLAHRYDMDTSSLKMRNIQDMFFKYNLQHWWDNNLYKFAGDMFMREAGTFSKFKFKDLDDYTQNMLIKYGIGDKEWNLIRTCKQTMPDGRDYISPEFLDKLRPEIEASLAKEVSGRLLQDTTDKTLGDLKDKFKLFYYDRIRNNVVPMPNARGRNLALWGSRAQKGTWSGEAIRSVMQFKGFTLSFMQNILGREVFGQGFTTAKDFATYGNVNRIGKLVAYMGIGGVMIQALRDLMAGKKPRDPRDPKTLMAGLAQSGGLGFGSDLLFGAYTRDGGTPLDAAMGPNFKLLDDILGLYGDIRNGDVSQAKANALRTLVSNTPFINMFYWRWAFNYGVIYPLQESMNPGFLARMQDRVKQQNDQTFWAPPSQFALKY